MSTCVDFINSRAVSCVWMFPRLMRIISWRSRITGRLSSPGRWCCSLVETLNLKLSTNKNQKYNHFYHFLCNSPTTGEFSLQAILSIFICLQITCILCSDSLLPTLEYCHQEDGAWQQHLPSISTPVHLPSCWASLFKDPCMENSWEAPTHSHSGDQYY